MVAYNFCIWDFVSSFSSVGDDIMRVEKKSKCILNVFLILSLVFWSKYSKDSEVKSYE